ncbi:MAG: hypothetical protein GWN58_27795 [Anaerolineae bacterium]|nr:hypothetical protein [Anaerolineae bacterium]
MSGSTPVSRGFYYTIEASGILSQVMGVSIPRSTITTNIKPPDDYPREKNRTGDLVATWPEPPAEMPEPYHARVWEIDRHAFERFVQDFITHKRPRRAANTLTIAEAADRLDLPRMQMREFVYQGRVPSVKVGEWRFITEETMKDIAWKGVRALTEATKQADKEE